MTPKQKQATVDAAVIAIAIVAWLLGGQFGAFGLLIGYILASNLWDWS